MFQVIHEQYPCDLPNRRALILDRISKHLPHKTRFHVVSLRNVVCFSLQMFLSQIKRRSLKLQMCKHCCCTHLYMQVRVQVFTNWKLCLSLTVKWLLCLRDVFLEMKITCWIGSINCFTLVWSEFSVFVYYGDYIDFVCSLYE